MRGIMRPAATVRGPRSGRPWATGAAPPRCAARAPGPGLTHRRCQCGHVLAAAQRGAFSGGAPVGEAFLGGSVAYLSAPGTAGEFAGPVPSGDARKVSRFRPELTSTGWTTDIGPLYRVRAWKMNVPAAAPHPSSHSGCRTRYNGSRQPLSRFSARMLVACWVIRVTALENAAASANATATITSQISFPSRLHRPDIGPDNPPGLAGKDLRPQAAAHETSATPAVTVIPRWPLRRWRLAAARGSCAAIVPGPQHDASGGDGQPGHQRAPVLRTGHDLTRAVGGGADRQHVHQRVS
jgi:hypothetical protein